MAGAEDMLSSTLKLCVSSDMARFRSFRALQQQKRRENVLVGGKSEQRSRCESWTPTIRRQRVMMLGACLAFELVSIGLGGGFSLLGRNAASRCLLRSSQEASHSHRLLHICALRATLTSQLLQSHPLWTCCLHLLDRRSLKGVEDGTSTTT